MPRTTLTTAHWLRLAAAEWPRRREIPSIRAYVAAVRRAQGWSRDDGPDGRLLAPLWREAPVRPSDRARIADWLAYWEASQPRPETVGSCHNQTPEMAARAWRLGIPPRLCPGPETAPEIPSRWRGKRHRIRALMRLGQLAPRLYINPHLRTSELRRLTRLSGCVLRSMECIPCDLLNVLHRRRVDWPAVAAHIARLRAVDRGLLQRARVPASRWLYPSDRDQERIQEAIIGRAAELVQALDEIPLPAPRPRRYRTRCLRLEEVN